MTGGRVLGFLLALAAQAAPPAAAPGELALENEDPPFKARLPRGYRFVKDPKVGYVHERSTGSADWEVVRVRVYRGEGAIPAGAAPDLAAVARLAFIPSDAKLVAAKETWGEFSVDAVEARYVQGTLPIYARAVHLPLEPRSAILVAFAPEPLEAEVRSDLSHAVRTLTGKSSWKTRKEIQREKQGNIALYGAIGLGVLYGVSVLVLFRGRPMTANVVRTIAQTVIGLAFFAPLSLGHPWGLTALAGALFFLSLAGRRIKLAIEEGD